MLPEILRRLLALPAEQLRRVVEQLVEDDEPSEARDSDRNPEGADSDDS